MVEAHLRLQDIDRVHNGQSADIRFTAFSQRTTMLVHGKVFYVSADYLGDLLGALSLVSHVGEVAHFVALAFVDTIRTWHIEPVVI
ncbi:HlyD family secretion protein [Variovorax sp. J22R133]|uniref:HlyD family secretion protein n=1 Tax=Variovorax brevis TaxID=3053503 RepID=UPI002577E91E|nr:HlyD family secretion protein [Variovorax sp. J22R133]MDM0116603.1 HlyD family secretion protein [Variovorax sp. J22R133]